MNALLIVLLSLTTYFHSDVEGVWLTANEDVKIEIYNEGSILNGKVVWLSDDSNSELKKGEVVLQNLRWDKEEKKFVNGILIYGNKKISCSIKQLSAEKLHVEMKKGIWSNTVIWSKVNN